MRIQAVDDQEAGGRWAAAHTFGLVEGLRHPVIGLVTGSSPRSFYSELAALTSVRAGRGGWTERVTFTMLDEYIGLSAEHPELYANVLQREVLAPLGCRPDQLVAFNAQALDLEGEPERYENQIAEMGDIDLQVLGVGLNGHIAFNEPPCTSSSPTRIVELDWSTRRANARFFGGIANDVPRRAFTRGVGEILRAERIVVFASGVEKCEAVAKLRAGVPDPKWPVTFLVAHERVTLVADHAALGNSPT